MDSEIGDVVDSVEAAVAALASADLCSIPGELIGSITVRMQRALRLLQVAQAGLVAHADSCAVWVGTTERSTAGWLATSTGTSFGIARRQVDLGAILTAAPHVRDAVVEGALSLDTVPALATAILDPAVDSADLSDLISLVQAVAPSQARKVVARWEAVRVSQSDGAQAEAQRHAKRSLTFTNTDEGMVRIEGTLTVIDARIIRNALSHVAGAPIDGDTRNTGQRTADALTDLCHAYAKGTITGGRGAPTVLVSVDYDVLIGRADGGAITSHGETITAETARQLCCDADIHRIITRGGSAVLDVGRKSRTATYEQYLALVVRDQHCRWPGCDRPPDWCDAHHVTHWTADQGQTNLNEMVLLCRHHHTTTHLPGYQITGNGQQLNITTPTGQTQHTRPPGRIASAAS